MLRPYLRRSRGAFLKLVLGTGLMFAGAIGVEALSNFVVQGSLIASLQVLVEEMLELVGATTILWGSYELVRNGGAMPRSFVAVPE